MTNLTDIPRTEVTSSAFHPDYWAVYVIEDPVMGYYAGKKPHYIPIVPLWCRTLAGAYKFDAFRDLDAKGQALAMRDYRAKNAKVWAYRRMDIYPEQYRKQEETK